MDGAAIKEGVEAVAYDRLVALKFSPDVVSQIRGVQGLVVMVSPLTDGNSPLLNESNLWVALKKVREPYEITILAGQAYLVHPPRVGVVPIEPVTGTRNLRNTFAGYVCYTDDEARRLLGNHPLTKGLRFAVLDYAGASALEYVSF